MTSSNTPQIRRRLRHKSAGGRGGRGRFTSEGGSTGAHIYADPEELRYQLNGARREKTILVDENKRLRTEIMRQTETNKKLEKQLTEGLPQPMSSSRPSSALSLGSRPTTPNPVLRSSAVDRWQTLTGRASRHQIARCQQSIKEKEGHIRRLHADIKMTSMNELRTQVVAYRREAHRLTYRLRQMEGGEEGGEDDYGHLSREELTARLNNVKEALVKQNEANCEIRLENARLTAEGEKEENDFDGDTSLTSLSKAQLVRMVGKLRSEGDEGGEDGVDHLKRELDRMRLSAARGKRERTELRHEIEIKTAELANSKRDVHSGKTRMAEERKERRVDAEVQKENVERQRGKMRRAIEEEEEMKEKLLRTGDNVRLFTREHAAKTIQRGWRDYSAVKDDALDAISSAALAHTYRRGREETLDAQETIAAAAKAHAIRLRNR